MNLPVLALYLFSIGAGLATLYLFLLLHRRFERYFLLNGLYYFIAFFAAGLIDLFGRYLVSQMMRGQPAETVLLLRHIFVFLVFPFIPAAIYFFASFITGLLGKKIPPRWQWIFAAFWAMFFLTLVVTTKNFLGGQDARFSGLLFSILGRTSFIFYLIISGFLWWEAGKFDLSRERRSLRILSLIYLAGFTLNVIPSEIAAASPSAGDPIAILFYFTFNLPPILFLRSQLEKFKPKLEILPPISAADLEDFFAKKGLSKREQEIVPLILEGKSNEEIARELYISIHTVKNHTYNVYQKLGVKNRLRLSRLVQSHRRNGND